MTNGLKSLNLEAYEATRAAVSRDPEAGKGSFESITEWREGAQAVTRARSFTIETDEPEALGGRDEQIDPMELLLASLGTCLTIGWATNARKRGVEFTGLKIRVHAPFDLRGYLNTDDCVRPGFTELAYTVEVESDADPETLEEIRQASEKTSPMFDNILNATPISGKIGSI